MSVSDSEVSDRNESKTIPLNGSFKRSKDDSNKKSLKRKIVVPAKPPDGGYGWMIVLASFLCNFIVDGVIFSFGIFLKDITNDLQVQRSSAAWVGSFQTGFYLIAGPFVSYLANKYDCRLVGIIGGLLSAIAFILSYYATDILTLCLAYGILGGIGYGFIYLPAVVIVSFYFDKKQAFATGIAVCGSGIGNFVLAPLIRLLVSRYGWRLSIALLAGVNLCCAFFALFFKPLKDEIKEVDDDYIDQKDANNNNNQATIHHKEQTVEPMLKSQIEEEEENRDQITYQRQRTDTVVSATGRDHRNRQDSIRSFTTRPRTLSASTISFAAVAALESARKSSFRGTINNETVDIPTVPVDDKKESSTRPMFDLTLLSSPTFLLFSFCGFLTLFGFFIPFMYIVDWASLLGISADHSAIILSTIGITNTLGRIMCGYFSDLPGIDPIMINNVALIVGGIFTIILPIYLTTYMLLIFYGIVFGFSIACFAALRTIMTTELFGMQRCIDAFGLLLLIQGIATMIGGPIAGWFFDITKSYNCSFYAAGVVIALSGILCIPLRTVSKWEKAKLSNKKVTSV